MLEDSGDATFGTWGIASGGQIISAGDTTFDFYDGVPVTQTSPGTPITYSASDGDFVAYRLQYGPENHRMYQDVALAGDATTLS